MRHDPYRDPAELWDLHDEDDTAGDRAYDAWIEEKLGVTP